MAYFVYIVTDGKNTKFAPGLTGNLVKRIHELKNADGGAAVAKGLNKLVYFEEHISYQEALRREKEVKDWDNDYMRQIVTLQNAKLEDLFNKIF